MVVWEEGGGRVVVGAGGESALVVGIRGGFGGEKVGDTTVGGRTARGFAVLGCVEESIVGGDGFRMVDVGEGRVVTGQWISRGLGGDG
jgi:hypothetical protein